MRRIAILLLLMSFLSACSSTKVLTPSIASSALPARVYFAPLDSQVELSRDRRGEIQRAVTAALRNRGFLVRIENGEHLPTFNLEISSFRRDTVLAGHVNTVTGSLSLVAEGGKKLVEIEHTEAERGGLLFETGQIFKGISEEIDNSSEESVSFWLQAFAEGITRAIPEPEADNVELLGSEPVIKTVELESTRAGKQLCLRGTGGDRAFVRTNDSSLPLRHVGEESDRFCVVIPAYFEEKDLVQGRAVLENDFGLRASRELSSTFLKVRAPETCGLEFVNLQRQGNGIVLKLSCSDSESGCSTERACRDATFRLYEVSPSGTALLVSEFGKDGTELKEASEASGGSYRVFRSQPSIPFPSDLMLTSVEKL